MKSAKSLLGMPVIRSGEKLGRVALILPDDDLRALCGVYISCGMAGTRFISRAQLDMIGEVSILVHDAGKRLSPDSRPLFRRALSADGRRIGAITDALIDEETLCIEALELSCGYIDDLLHGRTRIRQFMVQKNGDVIVAEREGGNLA